jgi:hypothetical protein
MWEIEEEGISALIQYYKETKPHRWRMKVNCLNDRIRNIELARKRQRGLTIRKLAIEYNMSSTRILKGSYRGRRFLIWGKEW